MARYMEVSTGIYSIFLKYFSSEDIHVYSIDESFIDLTAYLDYYKLTARELASKVVRDVFNTTGITATVGIGTNMYLAKVAMDIMAKKMPADERGMRIAELDEQSYRYEMWGHEPIKDFWRVGSGTGDGNEGGTGDEGDGDGDTVDLTGLAIGDLVNYTYDTVAEGYSLPGTQSGYNDQTVPQSTTTLQWKVLNIDEENGTIDLVSATPTSNTVYFKGALGYNNGVYLLDDMCAHLYSNSSLGVTARSIDLVDMERHLTTGENGGIAARNAYKSSSTNTVYGSTYKYETNRQYPKLYAHEIGQGIGVTDGSTIQQPTLDGSVLDPYNESSKYYTAPTTDTSDTADTALTVTQTYYYIPINEANYGPAAAVLSNSSSYWVASRCVLCVFKTDNAATGTCGSCAYLPWYLPACFV